MRRLGIVSVAAFSLAGCSGGKSDAPSSSASAREAPILEEPRAPASVKPPFTVASYNINAGMTGNSETLAAIAALEADVILLQEVTLGWQKLLADVHRNTHAHRAFHVDRRQHYGGLAVLSRFPISSPAVLRTGPGPFPAWRGILETPAGLVQLVNVHLFPPVAWFRERGIMTAYKDSQARHVEELEAHWPRIDRDLPTIIAGDFNENNAGAAIEWLEARGFSPAHAGSAPTWRWKVRGEFEVTFQLDHIMLRGLASTSAAVVKSGASDHFPITATLAAGN